LAFELVKALDQQEDSQKTSLVTSVEEAKSLLRRKDALFVDTRNYWRYVKGHIPRAHNLELYAFHWIDTSKPGISAFVDQMAMLFSSLGIDRSKHVVFYQNNSGYDAARGVWLLKFLGHERVSILDGGLNLWKRKGFPLSRSDPKNVTRGDFEPKVNNDILATLELLSNNSMRKIVDTRSQGEYSGRFRRALKIGHVPNAVNLEWKQVLRKDGTFKSAKQLKRLYSGLGLRERDEIVTYCQSGYRAAHSWLVLKMLDYRNVKNYLGSWYEWGNNPKTKVVR
jgi:thiosulfate/3-mercaptopyruvate sulfurtransferase